MTTIHKLGSLDMAGTKLLPSTFQIKACPKCYGVLYRSKKGQNVVTCDNCGHKVYMIRFKGPIDYVRRYLQTVPFGWQSLNLVAWAVVQKLDYHLKLRKLLLYLYMKGLSYL